MGVTGEKFPQRHAVAATANNYAFELKSWGTGQEHRKAETGRHGRVATAGERYSALSFRPGIRIGTVEQTIEPRVGKRPLSGRLVAGLYPGWLPCGFLAVANDHRGFLSGYCCWYFTLSAL